MSCPPHWLSTSSDSFARPASLGSSRSPVERSGDPCNSGTLSGMPGIRPRLRWCPRRSWQWHCLRNPVGEHASCQCRFLLKCCMPHSSVYPSTRSRTYHRYRAAFGSVSQIQLVRNENLHRGYGVIYDLSQRRLEILGRVFLGGAFKWWHCSYVFGFPPFI